MKTITAEMGLDHVDLRHEPAQFTAIEVIPMRYVESHGILFQPLHQYYLGDDYEPMLWFGRGHLIRGLGIEEMVLVERDGKKGMIRKSLVADQLEGIPVSHRERRIYAVRPMAAATA